MARNLGHSARVTAAGFLYFQKNIAIRFREKCMGQKLYSRIEKKPCVPETFSSRNPVVERILNPTGQKLHL